MGQDRLSVNGTGSSQRQWDRIVSASMGQDRLSDLALLIVERETWEKTDFNRVIDQFVTVKSRKINLM